MRLILIINKKWGYMKKSLKVIILFLAVLATPVFASTIDVTTNAQSYSFFSSILIDQFAVFEEGMEEYLGKKLECRLVNLKFNNMAEPRLFKKGQFSLTLNAECNKNIDDFNLEIARYGESNENGALIDLHVSYIVNGKYAEETFSNSEK